VNAPKPHAEKRSQLARSSASAEALPSQRGRGWLSAALTALYVARPLVPNDPVTDRGDGAVFVILWLLLAAAWLFHVGLRRRLAVRWGAVDLALLVLIGWHCLSGLLAVWQASPRPAINVTWQWLALAIGFFLVRQLVITAAEARAIMVAMIALAVALSALGVYQRLISYPRDRARYERIKDDPRKMIETVGEYFPPGSSERMQFENRLDANEPTATFALTNSLAGYLAPWLVVAIGVGWITWPAAGNRVASGVRLALLALPMAGTLVLTNSRSGLLAWCAGMAALWPACRPRRPVRRIAIAVGVAVSLAAVAIIASGGIDRQRLAGAGKSFGYRLEYWRSTLAMIGDHPWLGCGPGQFQDVYTRYKLPQASEEIRDPHNFVLEVWATAGSPAALALVVGLALFAYRMGVAQKQLSDPLPPHSTSPPGPVGPPGANSSRQTAGPLAEGSGLSRYVIAGASAGMALAAVIAPLAGFPLELAPTAITALALGAGLLIGRTWIGERDRLPARQRIWAVAAVGVFVLLVNLLAAGGIGYPGVAGTLWLLLAVGLNGAGHGDDRSTLPRYATAIGLATTGVLLLACYLTAYRPVLQSRAWITRSQFATGGDQAPQRAVCLQEAVRADPLSREAAQLLAAERYRQWQAAPTPERIGLLRTAVERATRLAPRASSFWSQAGQWWLDVERTSVEPRALEWALDAHQRAVRCYPNSGLLRARYAVALEAAGDVQAARQQAAMSLDLDAIAHRAGHRDKWLDAKLRDRVARIAGRGPN
jgi:O-antigen ligase